MLAKDSPHAPTMQCSSCAYRSFSAKHTYNSWLFCGKRPAPCIFAAHHQSQIRNYSSYDATVVRIPYAFMRCIPCVSMQCNPSASPQAEEIALKIVTTAQNSNEFTQESPYISNTFSRESPNVLTCFHGSKRKSPSLKRVDGKPVQSGDPNILSLISSVSVCSKLHVRPCSESHVHPTVVTHICN